jgi:hypothetical protein
MRCRCVVASINPECRGGGEERTKSGPNSFWVPRTPSLSSSPSLAPVSHGVTTEGARSAKVFPGSGAEPSLLDSSLMIRPDDGGGGRRAVKGRGEFVAVGASRVSPGRGRRLTAPSPGPRAAGWEGRRGNVMPLSGCGGARAAFDRTRSIPPPRSAPAVGYPADDRHAHVDGTTRCSPFS